MRNGFIGLNAVRHRSRKIDEGAWEANPPLPQQILETPVTEITYSDLGNEDVLVTRANFDHYVNPGGLPERISIILVEPFLGVKVEVSLDKVTQSKNEFVYLPWTELPDEPTLLTQLPESTFITPDASNNIIRLNLRLNGTKPPESGRLLYFIKYRVI